MSIKVGYTQSGAEKFLYSIPKNTTIRAKVLVNPDGIISGEICTHGPHVWAYSGPTDPIHGLDGQPRWMAIVPVVAKVANKKVRLNLRLPKSAADALVTFANEKGLRGRVFDFKRDDGDGKSFVRYSVVDCFSFSEVEESEEDIINEVLAGIIQGTPEEIAKIIGSSKKHNEEVL